MKVISATNFVKQQGHQRQMQMFEFERSVVYRHFIYYETIEQMVRGISSQAFDLLGENNFYMESQTN
jgi:hypothetical protein